MGNSVQKKSITYPDGNRYDGDTVNGRRHGYGSYYWVDGAHYEGQWSKGMMEGKGKLVFPNGSCFEGQFRRNNPSGYGALTTVNQERIDGHWQFLGRSDSVPDAYENPIGRYNLNASILDEATGLAKEYIGPATLHLRTGLVALPSMSDPNAPVFAHIVDPSTLNEEEKGKFADAIPVANVAETKSGRKTSGKANPNSSAFSASSSSASVTITSNPGNKQQGKEDKYEESGTAEVTSDHRDVMPEGESQAPDVVATQIVEGEPHNNQNGSQLQGGSLAYGYQDPALTQARKPPPKPLNPFDPRNYF